MSSDDQHFNAFPEHLEFFNKLSAGRATANKNGSRCYINWRGYRGFLNPAKNDLTKKDFMSHLTSALKGFESISAQEKQVI